MKHALLSENEQLSNELHRDEVVVEEIKDTKNIQVRSVKEFMQCLGYQHFVSCFGEDHFYSRDPENKHRQSVSWRTAIELHNGGLRDFHGEPLPQWQFNTYQETRAQASRIVEVVKLQWSKKEKRFIVQCHMVKFAHEDYERIFL